MLGNGQAIRYGIGVGRIGFGWNGTVHVGRQGRNGRAGRRRTQMITREAARGHMLPAHMKGGPGNPLGARALYLYGAGGDTGFRIHGTSQPWTIGLNVSSGCIRLVNDDVIDLYNRACRSAPKSSSLTRHAGRRAMPQGHFARPARASI